MRIVALFGPTGVGKTAVAIALARSLRARGEDPVAVSADALQVYAGLQTLTGVASLAEQTELEHRLVSFVSLTDTYSAGRYAKRAHAEIDSLLAAGRRPIVVGGTGLYLRGALTDLDFKPPPESGVREHWLAELERQGAPVLHAILAERAPAAAQNMDPNDWRRVIRALEIQAGGHGAEEKESQLWSREMRRPTLLVGLTMEREALYAQIDVRVQAMVDAGAGEEVLRARRAGASITARKALGFDELLRGDIEAMKKRTRNYAKRQLTWMRKLAGVSLIDLTGRDPDDVAAEIFVALGDETPSRPSAHVQGARGGGAKGEGTEARGADTGEQCEPEPTS
jgi:tRNA dimethylallyltransferase